MPFADLPLDIVHYIFLCGTEDLNDAIKISPAYSYPLKLTTICKQWTEAALSCPALWSTICINERRGELLPPLDVAGRWIERSGSHPLSFYITNRIEQLPNAVHILQTLFAPHYNRWGRIKVPVPFPLAILPKGVLNPQYPALRDITATGTGALYQVSNGPEVWETVGMDKIFGVLSSARGLSTASFLLAMRMTDRHITDKFLSELGKPQGPWTTLSNLSLQVTNFIPAMLLDILSQFCPNLESLIVHTTIVQDDLRPPLSAATIIHHRNLRILHFGSWKRVCLCASILGQLTLPSLLELNFEIMPTKDKAGTTVEAILGFLTRSRCPLEVVSIDAQAIMPDSPDTLLSQIIRALPPSVQALTIKASIHHEPVLAVLKALVVPETGEQGTLLPRLQTLTIRMAKWNKQCCSAVVDMLKSRRTSHPGRSDQGGMGLRTVELTLIDVWHTGIDTVEEFKEQLRQLGGSVSQERINKGMIGMHLALTWRRN